MNQRDLLTELGVDCECHAETPVFLKVATPTGTLWFSLAEAQRVGPADAENPFLGINNAIILTAGAVVERRPGGEEFHLNDPALAKAMQEELDRKNEAAQRLITSGMAPDLTTGPTS